MSITLANPPRFGDVVFARCASTILVVDSRAELGRAEGFLRAIGLAIWVFVAAPKLSVLVHGGGAGVWLPVWIAYGAGLVATAFRGLPVYAAIAVLFVQSAATLALPRLGVPGFEGLMLSVVTVQARTVLSTRGAVMWAILQAVALFIAVVFRERARDIVAIMGAYSGFSAFALGVIELREREASSRRDLQRLHGELLAMQDLLAQSSRVAERLEISRELHDALGHHLAALNIQLELASHLAEGKAAGPVRDAHGMSRKMLGEVRSVVHSMREERAIDLSAALHTLAGAIPKPKVHLAIDGSVRVEDTARAHALFRCAQESLTNAIKHGQPDNVWIDVGIHDGAIDLKVRDDGRGAPNVSPGSGLNGMRDRMEELGGSVEFGPTASGGFEVRCNVPLKGDVT